ncbi:MAG: type II toxin-antitoxin system RelE/ParE family toxin [Desulfobacterales bacterium]|nr:type II toxin-antitoxin system RelE/ParE family toxin [Desulfobacterales bacterium]
MELPAREIVMLETLDGKVPFEEWFNGIRDQKLQISVDARLTRIADGNFGDHKSLRGGVFELRVHKGPGLRVYYGLDGPRIVVLIGGGVKSTQGKDIRKAQELWKEYYNAK